MKGKGFNKFLTVFLIILIILIVGAIGYILFNIIKAEKNNNDASEYVDEFITDIGEMQNQDESTESSDNNEGDNVSDENNRRNWYRTKQYKGYDVIGIIRIPKTNVKYPILEELTVRSLNTSVVAIYPEPPVMNSVGNVVIIGHNNLNRQFFSKNKNLSKGDKIYITGLDGMEYRYSIYKTFRTTEDDTRFYNRDTGGKREITLSTCTDNSKARIIIQAVED